jgi:hypothetical protein
MSPHVNIVIIPTGASLFRRKSEAGWSDLVFPRILRSYL